MHRPAALSRQIRLLEEELGVTLFLRGKKKIQLTEEGRFLKQQAEEIIELMEKTREQMGRLGGGVHGLVSVAAVESFGIGLLSEMVEDVSQRVSPGTFPDLCGNSDEVRDKLERGCRCGNRAAPVYMEQCEQIFLRSEPWVAAMSRRHPLAAEEGDEVRLEQLGGETLMIPVRASLQEEINHWFNEIAQDREILCYYNSSASMLPLVERGMGIAICGAARYLPGERGSLQDDRETQERVTAVYVRRRYQMLPQAAGAFWDFAGRKFCGVGDLL